MKKFLLLLVDIATLYGALVLTLAIRYHAGFAYQYRLHLVPFTIIFALWILAFYISNLYDQRLWRNTVHFMSALLRAGLFAVGFSVAFFYLIPIYGITPKTNLFLFILVFGILEVAVRAIFNSLIETRFRKPIAIVGINPQSIELAQHITLHPQLGYEVRYFVDITPVGRADEDLAGLNITQGTDTLAHAIQHRQIEAVIISPEAYQHQDIIDLFYKSLEYRISFYNLASFYEKVTGKVPLGAINQIWFLENISEGSRNIYEVAKRAGDVVLACILGAAFLVMFPFIAMAIAVDSPGPVFYKQKRLGRAAKPFDMLKLRTMRPDAEKATGAVWTKENDPRITRVGRLLRKSRIDELPQVWNVLKGELSFVGPRTERPEFHDTLKQEIPFYEERYLITPGLTGLSQLYFGYGASITDAAQKLQYDLYYIKNRSLILDIGVLLKTINLVVRGGGR